MAKTHCIAALIAALAFASVEAKADEPCGTRLCRAAIRASPDRTAHWTSGQTFASTRGVPTYVLVNGKQLSTAEYVNRCRIRYYGRGIILAIASCGRPRFRLDIRIHSLAARPLNIRLFYGGDLAPRRSGSASGIRASAARQ
jgi:hypothetical protein